MLLRRSAFALVLALALAATAPASHSSAGEADAGGGAPAMVEPSAGFSLAVRLIRITGQGATRRALLELSLFSDRELENLSVDRASGRDAAVTVPVALPANSRSLTAWSARKIQLSLDLEEGLVHHLHFAATGEGRAGGSRRATAYLRINLDSETRGRRLDMEDRDLIQYGPAGGGQGS